MRYFDRNIGLDQASLDPRVQALLGATLYNKQVFENQSVKDGSYLTKGIKYAADDRPRPKFRDIDELRGDFNRKRVEEILSYFGYEKGLQFQVSSWKTISNQLAQKKYREEHRAAMVSAPTGFGKTAAFMGRIFYSLLRMNGDQQAIFVYPSRALLRDQLQRVLHAVDNIKSRDDVKRRDLPSVGVWSSSIPYEKGDVLNEDKSLGEYNDGEFQFQLTSHWDDSLSDRDFILEGIGGSQSNNYRIINRESDTKFTYRQLALHRNWITEHPPEILLTTLESLENIALKPHYSIIDNAKFIVLDEIHQYSGLRGSHAANIISNVKRIREDKSPDDPYTLFIGSSATVEEPTRFASKVFGLDEQAVHTVEPSDFDIDEKNGDKQHYYFTLTPDEGPGVASQYIQQAMMLGHSVLLDGKNNELRSKYLTFIDSISQINRISGQLQDADQKKQLWRKHINIEEGDWLDLASSFDNSFYSKPLPDPARIYADSEDGLNMLESSPIIHGSSFLEVGVDIEDLGFVSQYRPPRNMSSFTQRTGRAAREKTTSGHTFIHLSNYGGDSNFFYRADRFLDRDISTPLSENNHVIDWMHDRFFDYYESLYSLYKRTGSGWWKKRYLPQFIREYFGEELGYNLLTEFLFDYNRFVQSTLDISAPVDDLVDLGGAKQADKALEDMQGSIRSEFNEESFATKGSINALLLQDNPATELVSGFNKELLSIIGDLEDCVDDVKRNTEGDELSHLNDELSSVREEVSELDAREAKEALKALSHFRNEVSQLEYRVTQATRETKVQRPKVGERLNRLRRGIESAIDRIENEELNYYANQQQKVYYLRKALSELTEFLNGYTPHGNIYSVKHMFRVSYYLNKYTQVETGQSGFQLKGSLTSDGIEIPKMADDEEFWYVPQNYFDDAGRYFTLVESGQDQSSNEEEVSVEKLLTQYIPYKIEFMNTEGQSQVFLPKVYQTKPGTYKMHFKNTPGTVHKDVKIPDRIKMNEIHDMTGGESQGIYAYNPNNLELLRKEEAEDLEPVTEYGKFHSSALISTDVEKPYTIDNESNPDNANNEASMSSISGLTISNLDAKAWIDEIELSVRKYRRTGGGFRPIGEDERTYNIEVEGQPFGYVLETRGLEWDLSSFVEKIKSNESLKNEIRKYKSLSEEGITFERIALTTAAHFLTLLVADVSGVNSDLLLYNVDEESSTVYVFEQTEGGQGIVDLFFREFGEYPAEVLESVFRLMHNPQRIAEEIWAKREKDIKRSVDIQRLDEASTEERQEELTDLQEVIRDETGITYENSLKRISEEIAKTLSYIANLKRRDVSSEDLYRLKSRLATKRLEGVGDFQVVKHEIRRDFGAVLENSYFIESEGGWETSIENMFWSPDIDSCAANLLLTTTAAEKAQEKLLSNTLLMELEDHILTTVPEEDEIEGLSEHGYFWARVEEGYLTFISL